MIQIRLNGRSLYSFLSARLTGLPCTQVSLYVRVIPPRALSAISNKRGLQASKTRLFPSAPVLRDCARYVSNASFEMGLRAPDLACSRSAVTASHLRPSEIGSRFEQYLHKLRANRVADYRLGGLLVLRLSVDADLDCGTFGHGLVKSGVMVRRVEGLLSNGTSPAYKRGNPPATVEVRAQGRGFSPMLSASRLSSCGLTSSSEMRRRSKAVTCSVAPSI
jgi:hypothetical protein